MANLSDLANRLNKLANTIEAAPSKVAAEIALILVDELTDRTPVDTSKAISNWLVSLEDPVLVDLDAYFEGLQGSTFKASKNEVIAFAKSKLAAKTPGEEIFISNSAPYIRDLENGSSAQAPVGFTKQSAMIARGKVKTIFKKVMSNG